MKNFIQNIECVRIELADGQTTYYIPYTRKEKRRVSRVLAYLPNYNAQDITGHSILRRSEAENAYVTIVGDGGDIAKDMPLGALSVSLFDQPNTIDGVVDFDNSYIRFNGSTSGFDGRVLLIYLVYETQREVANRQYKVLTVHCNNTRLKPARLSDYIVGYQGELVRVETQSDDKAGAFLSISDANGLSVDCVPCDMFRTDDHARIFNPYYFAQVVPDWQNSYIYSRGEFTLNLYLKQ